MSELTFFIDIEDGSGNRLGSGPITSAAQWTYTARMDRAGEFSFSLPATDAQAGIVQRKRIARAYALVGGAWTEVGAGIIDNIVRRPQADGTVLLDVSGADLLRELTYRSVRNLKLYSGGSPVSHAASVSAVAAYAPDGWTLTPDAAPPVDSIYGRYNGESVLAAIIKIADKSQTHFYRGSGRSVVFAHEFSDSGIRAIQAGPGDLATETCAITALTETVDTYDMLTRIYPRGSGNGDVQLTLRATTRSAPAGYTLDAANNYIENDAATAEFGRIEEYVEWREIGPVANTIPDIQAASDMLFDEALRELVRRSEEIETPYYALALAGCGALLRPMQTVRVVWRDTVAGVDVDADLNIIEATWRVDASGVQTTALTVTTSDRWPQNDAGAIVESMRQGIVYQAHPQLNANSYTTGYTKNIDSDYNAVFRFRLGAEVVQVQQVLMEFQLLPFESTVKAIGTETGGSGEIPTGGPSTNETSLGGNDETGSGGGGETGSASPGTGSASPGTGSASPATGSPQGGDVISAGRHGHQIYLKRGSFDAGTWLNVYFNNYEYRFYVIGGSGAYHGSLANMTTRGDHSHTTAPHSHTTAPHSHTTAAHTHTTAAHTHTMADHTHSLNNHTHSLSEAIEAVYGVFREAEANTYEIRHLQYRVNSGAWAALAGDAEDAGGDWWRLDVTDAIIDADTFRPTQEANTIEVRAARLDINVYTVTWDGYVTGEGIEDYFEVGDLLTIVGTEHYDGTWTVEAVGEGVVRTDMPGVASYGVEYGVAEIDHTVTIDALLSVRNVIQAIAYV